MTSLSHQTRSSSVDTAAVVMRAADEGGASRDAPHGRVRRFQLGWNDHVWSIEHIGPDVKYDIWSRQLSQGFTDERVMQAARVIHLRLRNAKAKHWTAQPKSGSMTGVGGTISMEGYGSGRDGGPAVRLWVKSTRAFIERSWQAVQTERFVGALLNPLRGILPPQFAYVIDAWYDDENEHVAYEDIPRVPRPSSLRSSTPGLTGRDMVKERLGTLLKLLFPLAIADRAFGFVHGDIHPENVIERPTPGKVYCEYVFDGRMYRVSSGKETVPVLIDFDKSDARAHPAAAYRRSEETVRTFWGDTSDIVNSIIHWTGHDGNDARPWSNAEKSAFAASAPKRWQAILDELQAGQLNKRDVQNYVRVRWHVPRDRTGPEESKDETKRAAQLDFDMVTDMLDVWFTCLQLSSRGAAAVLAAILKRHSSVFAKYDVIAAEDASFSDKQVLRAVRKSQSSVAQLVFDVVGGDTKSKVEDAQVTFGKLKLRVAQKTRSETDNVSRCIAAACGNGMTDASLIIASNADVLRQPLSRLVVSGIGGDTTINDVDENAIYGSCGDGMQKPFVIGPETVAYIRMHGLHVWLRNVRCLLPHVEELRITDVRMFAPDVIFVDGVADATNEAKEQAMPAGRLWLVALACAGMNALREIHISDRKNMMSDAVDHMRALQLLVTPKCWGVRVDINCAPDTDVDELGAALTVLAQPTCNVSARIVLGDAQTRDVRRKVDVSTDQHGKRSYTVSSVDTHTDESKIPPPVMPMTPQAAVPVRRRAYRNSSILAALNAVMQQNQPRISQLAAQFARIAAHQRSHVSSSTHPPMPLDAASSRGPASVVTTTRTAQEFKGSPEAPQQKRPETSPIVLPQPLHVRFATNDNTPNPIKEPAIRVIAADGKSPIPYTEYQKFMPLRPFAPVADRKSASNSMLCILMMLANCPGIETEIAMSIHFGQPIPTSNQEWTAFDWVRAVFFRLWQTDVLSDTRLAAGNELISMLHKAIVGFPAVSVPIHQTLLMLLNELDADDTRPERRLRRYADMIRAFPGSNTKMRLPKDYDEATKTVVDPTFSWMMSEIAIVPTESHHTVYHKTTGRHVVAHMWHRPVVYKRDVRPFVSVKLAGDGKRDAAQLPTAAALSADDVMARIIEAIASAGAPDSATNGACEYFKYGGAGKSLETKEHAAEPTPMEHTSMFVFGSHRGPAALIVAFERDTIAPRDVSIRLPLSLHKLPFADSREYRLCTVVYRAPDGVDGQDELAQYSCLTRQLQPNVIEAAVVHLKQHVWFDYKADGRMPVYLYDQFVAALESPEVARGAVFAVYERIDVDSMKRTP